MAKGKLAVHENPVLSAHLNGVPILIYHSVVRKERSDSLGSGSKFSVPQQQFKQQLDLIDDKHARCLKLEQFWNLSEGRNRVSPLVVLTFDDGRLSDYETVFPMLQEHCMQAEFFINPTNVNKPGYLSWSQIVEMSRAGMSFQSHGNEHIDLSACNERQLRYQLGNSKLELESRLGVSVDFLAVPYGLINQLVIDAAKEQGYKAVCTSRNWPASNCEQTISRTAIYRHTSMNEFERLIDKDPWVYLKRTAREALLFIPKKILMSMRPQMLITSEEGRHA